MYIVKRDFENQEMNYLLKLNRTDHKLEVYQKADNSVLNEHYSIRSDFDASGYTMYEKLKSIRRRKIPNSNRNIQSRE